MIRGCCSFSESLDASRGTMGTGVVFGMPIATVIGLFLIPVR